MQVRLKRDNITDINLYPYPLNILFNQHIRYKFQILPYKTRDCIVHKM